MCGTTLAILLAEESYRELSSPRTHQLAPVHQSGRVGPNTSRRETTKIASDIRATIPWYSAFVEEDLMYNCHLVAGSCRANVRDTAGD